MWLYEGIIETMKENWVWNLFMALEVSEGYWSLVFTFGQTSIIKSMPINKIQHSLFISFLWTFKIHSGGWDEEFLIPLRFMLTWKSERLEIVIFESLKLGNYEPSWKVSISLKPSWIFFNVIAWISSWLDAFSKVQQAAGLFEFRNFSFNTFQLERKLSNFKLFQLSNYLSNYI